VPQSERSTPRELSSVNARAFPRENKSQREIDGLEYTGTKGSLRGNFLAGRRRINGFGTLYSESVIKYRNFGIKINTLRASQCIYWTNLCSISAGRRSFPWYTDTLRDRVSISWKISWKIAKIRFTPVFVPPTQVWHSLKRGFVLTLTGHVTCTYS